MSNRALFITLTLMTAWGGSTASAMAQWENAWAPGEFLLAQAPQPNGNTPDAPPTQTAPPPSQGVQNLQIRLSQLGHYSGPIDGVYGPGTRDAVSSFQQSAGLARTGVVDPLTIERLQTAQPPLPGAAPSSQAPATEPTEPTEPEVAPELPETPEDPATQAPTGEAPSPAVPDLLPEDGAEAPVPDADVPDASEGAGEAEAEDESNAESDGGGAGSFIGAAIVGAVVALLGTVGGLVLLQFTKKSPAEDAFADDRMHQTTPAIASPPAPVTPPATPAIAANGTPQPSGNVVAPAGALQVGNDTEATTRLTKVNIIDELIQDLENPDPTLRRKAVWELGQRGNSAAVQPLVNLMINADSKEQSLILAALAEIGTRTLKPMNRALAISLQDENPEVRKNAIRDLTRIYDLMGQVGHVLGHATRDSDPEVRKTASWALGQLNRMRLVGQENGASMLQSGQSSLEQLPEDTVN